ncbi:hydantoinase/oxoprolinase family protein [Geodermatophilus poikilotrophus]|uniref:N-methylhydantoinase A n=1 Tax=Geodermatophilus poikilotrophus TaxID=1333667 RepID=A0A1I0GRZ7_9ACTN|nr:hydantoinase/oxoprolinase family protein [Geodermatophilus poikilotrophus]SET73918.1 N-methylhydantoinase A [Geodermatophilus poikilotrophus]
MEPRRVRIGIDTGGTFTDVVAVDEATGRTTTTKTPSTPADPAEGFLTGVRKVLGLLGLDGSAVTAVSHGTTVATNQLLEGELDRIGFLTTEGYESVLEIARQSVPDGYGNSYFWVKPPRIVPADLVRTVRGRLGSRGEEVRPLDEEDARAAARFFRDAGVGTIGVCLLHSYADDAHERRVLEILREEHPGAVVSASSQVLREYREYERSVTTLVDAAVKPRVGAYVTAIREGLDGIAPGVPFYVMKSNGGVLSAAEVVHQPITTVLSGPAAGALGAALVAGAAGFDRVLTCDGGGTSTDVAVVVDGEPAITTEGSVGAYPSKIPMIDVVTVGAGGGSIAWLSPEGTLKVGPRSAGADPGPICYPSGGSEPTVTDAHVVLGRIPPHLLGGEIPLSVGAARAGLEQLGEELDLDLERTATGILEISAWNQANALRQVTVARGLDVRDFTLTTFGGSGSLLACRLMDVLGLPRTLVPPDPGNLSAFGLLTVDVRNDHVQTAISRHADLDLDRVRSVFTSLEDDARAALDGEGFSRDRQRLQRSADLRYVGQAFEVRVPVADGDLDAAAVDQACEGFHAAHRVLYGYDFAEDPRQAVEWVNLRVSGIGPIRRPDLVELAPADGPVTDRAVTGSRPVFFDGDWVGTPTYDRPRLAPGDVVPGPAVIEEFGSTVPVHPGFHATVDRHGNLLIERDA